MADAPPTTAAERKREGERARQRLCRRRKDGQVRPMAGDVPTDLVNALVENDWLGPVEAKVPRKLGAALIDLADCWMNGTLVPPKT